MGNFEFRYQREEEKGHAQDRIMFSLGRSWYTIVLMTMEKHVVSYFIHSPQARSLFSSTGEMKHFHIKPGRTALYVLSLQIHHYQCCWSQASNTAVTS